MIDCFQVFRKTSQMLLFVRALQTHSLHETLLNVTKMLHCLHILCEAFTVV